MKFGTATLLFLGVFTNNQTTGSMQLDFSKVPVGETPAGGEIVGENTNKGIGHHDLRNYFFSSYIITK